MNQKLECEKETKRTRCRLVEDEHVWAGYELKPDADTSHLSTTYSAGVGCSSPDARVPYLGEAQLLEDIFNALAFLSVRDVFR